MVEREFLAVFFHKSPSSLSKLQVPYTSTWPPQTPLLPTSTHLFSTQTFLLLHLYNLGLIPDNFISFSFDFFYLREVRLEILNESFSRFHYSTGDVFSRFFAWPVFRQTFLTFVFKNGLNRIRGRRALSPLRALRLTGF